MCVCARVRARARARMCTKKGFYDFLFCFLSYDLVLLEKIVLKLFLTT